MNDTRRKSTRRYLKGEQTREQILLAAKKLFTNLGYNNTSIYDLFERAGITKGAFYHHWKTKEELAITLVEEMRQAYEQRIFPVFNQPQRARDTIEQTLQLIEELNLRNDWHYCRLLAKWSTELDPKDEQLGKYVHLLKEQWLMYWTYLLERAQQEGDLRADIPPRELAFLVICTIFGMHLLESETGSNTPTTVRTIRKLLFT